MGENPFRQVEWFQFIVGHLQDTQQLQVCQGIGQELVLVVAQLQDFEHAQWSQVLQEGAQLVVVGADVRQELFTPKRIWQLVNVVPGDVQNLEWRIGRIAIRVPQMLVQEIRPCSCRDLHNTNNFSGVRSVWHLDFCCNNFTDFRFSIDLHSFQQNVQNQNQLLNRITISIVNQSNCCFVPLVSSRGPNFLEASPAYCVNSSVPWGLAAPPYLPEETPACCATHPVSPGFAFLNCLDENESLLYVNWPANCKVVSEAKWMKPYGTRKGKRVRPGSPKS